MKTCIFGVKTKLLPLPFTILSKYNTTSPFFQCSWQSLGWLTIASELVSTNSQKGMTIDFIGVTQFCYVIARIPYSDSICTPFSTVDSLAWRSVFGICDTYKVDFYIACAIWYFRKKMRQLGIEPVTPATFVRRRIDQTTPVRDWRFIPILVV